MTKIEKDYNLELIQEANKTLNELKKESFPKSKEYFKVMDKLTDFVVEFMIDHETCPECGSNLEIIQKMEDRGECHGVPSFETIEYYYCQKCDTDF